MQIKGTIMAILGCNVAHKANFHNLQQTLEKLNSSSFVQQNFQVCTIPGMKKMKTAEINVSMCL